jgi:glycosyltransferase involved in cell wall biosynthesis
MRVLLVTNVLGVAGAETQLEHLAFGLRGAGHRVAVVAIGGRSADPAPLVEAGIEVVVIGARGPRRKLRVLPRLRELAAAADVVHCTGWDATLWGRLAARAAGTPVVITEHTPGRDAQAAGEEGGRGGARVIALHNRLLDPVTYATIAVGAWQRALLESEGVRPESIVHIPNGVPVAALREQAAAGPGRADLGLPDDALIVVQAARFAPQKGQARTLAAVAALREQLGDVRVLFVGGGEGEAPVRARAAELGADWATFAGYRHDVPALLGLADLAVLPSDAEGLPMTLLETVAVGTPIVATDVGDVGWFIAASGAGVAVPPGDQEAFEAACRGILADPERRRRIVATERERAMDFDAATMVRRYEAVFAAAVAGAPLPVSVEEVG